MEHKTESPSSAKEKKVNPLERLASETIYRTEWVEGIAKVIAISGEMIAIIEAGKREIVFFDFNEKKEKKKITLTEAPPFFPDSTQIAITPNKKYLIIYSNFRGFIIDTEKQKLHKTFSFRYSSGRLFCYSNQSFCMLLEPHFNSTIFSIEDPSSQPNEQPAFIGYNEKYVVEINWINAPALSDCHYVLTCYEMQAERTLALFTLQSVEKPINPQFFTKDGDRFMYSTNEEIHLVDILSQKDQIIFSPRDAHITSATLSSNREYVFVANIKFVTRETRSSSESEHSFSVLNLENPNQSLQLGNFLAHSGGVCSLEDEGKLIIWHEKTIELVSFSKKLENVNDSVKDKEAKLSSSRNSFVAGNEGKTQKAEGSSKAEESSEEETLEEELSDNSDSPNFGS